MPSKNPKPRRLWLNVRLSIPGPVQRLKPIDRGAYIRRVLTDSIKSGVYELPRGWSAEIHWRNKEDAPNRVGEWQNELLDSATSSPGFERALLSWIERNVR